MHHFPPRYPCNGARVGEVVGNGEVKRILTINIDILWQNSKLRMVLPSFLRRQLRLEGSTADLIRNCEDFNHKVSIIVKP